MLNLLEESTSNHLREMATYLEADLITGNDASTITLDNQHGKGFISSYSLFNGLTVWVYNLTFLLEFKVDLMLSKGGPIYFCYNVKGHFFHRFGEHEEFSKVLQNQQMIVIGSPNNSVQMNFPINVKLEIAVVVVDSKLLSKLNIANADRIYSKVQKIFKEIPKNQPYRHLGEIEALTAKYASIVCQNRNTTLVGKLHTEGAVLNMLASQIQAYEKISTVNTTHPTLTNTDLSKISSLGEYIFAQPEKKTTILELSRHFRLSPKKLQMGVRHLYGDSVGNYILNLRLELSKHLLDTTDLNISEVCYQIGISSQSYFSKVFKNKYAMLPSKYKKNNIRTK